MTPDHWITVLVVLVFVGWVIAEVRRYLRHRRRRR